MQSGLRLVAGINGYDFGGLISGRLASDHWTCIGACMQVYTRIGVPIQDYGVGLFGLGTGWLDPILPVRFLYDPAMTVLHEPGYQAPKPRRPKLHEVPVAPVLAATDLVGATTRRGRRLLKSIR